MITLVDQGSDPKAIAVLREYVGQFANVNLVELQKNVGVAAGRNLGMRRGTADVIVSIDNDATLASRKALYNISQCFDNAPGLGAIGFRIEDFTTGNLDPASWVYPKALLRLGQNTFLATRFCGAGHAIRRSAFEKTGGYDERLFFYWEELDLSYQLINHGYSISYEPSVVVRHKISPEGRSHWRRDRFYYLVRNALYLDSKYFGSSLRLAGMAAGYLAKGLYNRTFRQALRGVGDAFGMVTKLKPTERIQLNSQALLYIRENDLRYRGSVWDRIKSEVLSPLPGA